MFRTTSRARGAAVAAIVASALLLAACSGGASASSTGGKADTAKLTIGLDSDQAALGYDPLKYSGGQRMFFEGVYDSLFKTDKDGKIVPDLVKKFTYSPDNTQLTLELDTSATFDDGSKLTADLVKKNLDSRSNTDLTAYTQFAKGGSQEISDVTVVDDHTVTLHFAAPQPGFQANLAFPAGVIVGEKGVADRAGLSSTPDGSGPLQIDVKSSVKGNTYVETKKKGNAEASSYPFDSYVFKVITDGQARANAAISGQVDTAFLAPETQQQVTSSGTGLVANGGVVVNLIPFDKSGALAPQWGDPNVFTALSVAIDRNAFVKAVHPGQVPTANVLPKDSPGYLRSLEKDYAYDAKEAKKLLADAGYPNGFSFDFVITPSSQRDMEAIQTYWKAIGVNVNLKNASSTEEAFAAVQTTPIGGPIPMSWDNPAGNVFGALFGFANFHKAQNAAIQGAAGAVNAAGTDSAKQKDALTNLNKTIAESGWLIPLYEQLSPWAYNTKKIAKPTFPGSNSFPVLSSLTPAS